MNIKTRLAFQFTLIVAGILLFFSALVYYFSYSSQLGKFRDNLLERAKNNAILLIDVSEVDSVLLKKIHESTFSLEDEEIAVCDSTFQLLYSNNRKHLSDQNMRLNSGDEDVLFFTYSEKDGVYLKHYFKNVIYHVYILAFDKSRKENLLELRKILFWSILVSIWVSVFFAYLFSRKAMKPISMIIKSVKEINSSKLNNKLDEGNRKDEMAQLAITFNEMLSDLEIAFKNQEEFVSNASHEMRTPLAVMIAESDYILSREMSGPEYVNHISNMISDLKGLNSLLNNLLELAHINKDRNIILSSVRIDEIIFNAIHLVKSKYQGRKIIPKIKYPEIGNDLFIYGNEGLLTIVFKNLIDNACKFSDKEVIVEFALSNEFINILVSDSGIGIPESDKGNIIKPFKRAQNVRFIGGFGIGLTLVSRIIELHNAKINIHSKENEGTRVEIIFKRISE